MTADNPFTRNRSDAPAAEAPETDAPVSEGSYIASIQHNLGAEPPEEPVTLGRVTVLHGNVRAGKTSVVRALELLTTGTASDVQGRDGVKARARLQWLTPDGSDPKVTATLSDGTEVKYTPSLGPALEGVTLGFAEARAALTGSEASARAFLAPYLDMTLNDDTALDLLPKAQHDAYKAARETEDAPLDTLDRMYRRAKDAMAEAGREKRDAEAAMKGAKEAPDPKALKLAETKAEAAQEAHEAAQRALVEAREALARLEGQASAGGPSQDEVRRSEQRWRGLLETMQTWQGKAEAQRQRKARAEGELQQAENNASMLSTGLRAQEEQTQQQRAYLEIAKRVLHAQEAMIVPAKQGQITDCLVCGHTHATSQALASGIEAHRTAMEQVQEQMKTALSAADETARKATAAREQVEALRGEVAQAEGAVEYAEAQAAAVKREGSEEYARWEKLVQAQQAASANTGDSAALLEARQEVETRAEATREAREAANEATRRYHTLREQAAGAEGFKDAVRRKNAAEEKYEAAKIRKAKAKETSRHIAREAVEALEAMVNDRMPETLDGEPIRFGLDADSFLWGLRIDTDEGTRVQPVLSGGEWMVTLTALGSLLADQHDYVLLVPEERSIDAGAFTEWLRALDSYPDNVQVVITSTTKPKGRMRQGITLIEVT